MLRFEIKCMVMLRHKNKHNGNKTKIMKFPSHNIGHSGGGEGIEKLRPANVQTYEKMGKLWEKWWKNYHQPILVIAEEGEVSARNFETWRLQKPSNLLGEGSQSN